jgi:hypothetical protein
MGGVAAPDTQATPHAAGASPDQKAAWTMTGARCTPAESVLTLSEREGAPDRFVELLECLADLLVETGLYRESIAARSASADPRVREALDRTVALERSIKQVGVDAATVHQLLEHIRLI